MDPKIGTLAIENFRVFKKFQIEGLKQVNLITGKNNTGKSSILEAIQLLASEGNQNVIRQIMDLREEFSALEDATQIPDAEDLFPSGLFFGFPQFGSKPKLKISANGEKQMHVEIQSSWLSGHESASEEYGKKPALSVTTDRVKSKFPLENFKYRPNRVSMRIDERLPCLYTSPYGGERTANVGFLWDRIALSEREKDVIEGLKIIDSDISAVSMIGGESQIRSRIAIVRTHKLKKPVPLRSFGDGLNRLFGMLLCLVNSKNGILLIDEFENGLHHTIQIDIWRVIFDLAKRLDVQVIATSHSWDAVEAFQKAACESPEDGVLVRLTRKDDEIIPTLFSEQELAIATRDRIEVR